MHFRCAFDGILPLMLSPGGVRVCLEYYRKHSVGRRSCRARLARRVFSEQQRVKHRLVWGMRFGGDFSASGLSALTGGCITRRSNGRTNLMHTRVVVAWLFRVGWDLSPFCLPVVGVDICIAVLVTSCCLAFKYRVGGIMYYGLVARCRFDGCPCVAFGLCEYRPKNTVRRTESGEGGIR